MAAAIWFGTRVEAQLAAVGLGGSVPGESLFRQIAPYLFAFGFPLGVVLCALAVRVPWSAARAERWPIMAAAGLLVAAPLLVPLLAGRGAAPGYLGAGGILIAACAVLSFLFLGQVRRGLASDARGALDLLVWGLACFAVAAWNLCGTVAMPSHLLSPETVLRLDTLPFAMGQTKTVMALLAGGWLLVLLAARKALTVMRRADARAG